MSKNWFDNTLCTPGGIYCRVCRARETSAHRNAILAQYTETPVDGVDFDCPKGVAWGWVGPRAKGFAMTPEQQSLIDARKAICAACEHNQGLTLRTVKCRNCGCSGVSLLHGMCKLGKWNP